MGGGARERERERERETVGKTASRSFGGRASITLIQRLT